MPAFSPEVSIIGTGNVAWHLAQGISKAGYRVVQVFGRSPDKAAQLADLLPTAAPTSETDFTQQPADIYLIALADNSVAEFMAKAVFPEGSLVAHTSGSLPMEVLQQSHTRIRTGVFYPLQTFSKNRKLNFEEIPFLIEAEDEVSLQQLQQLAGTISKKVQKMSFAERKILHLAAVFACNFTNHLLGISHELVQQHHLDWQLLKPLITETLAKALEQPPFSVQTGPAIRHDQVIIREHLQQLAAEPVYQQIYQLLTESIQKKAKK